MFAVKIDFQWNNFYIVPKRNLANKILRSIASDWYVNIKTNNLFVIIIFISQKEHIIIKPQNHTSEASYTAVQ